MSKCSRASAVHLDCRLPNGIRELSIVHGPTTAPQPSGIAKACFRLSFVDPAVTGSVVVDRMSSVQKVDAVIRLFIFLYQVIKSPKAASESWI
jgi:hypothetical protein